MDQISKDVLKKSRLTLKQTLRSTPLVDYLLQNEILTDNDYEEIRELKEIDKVTYILDVLPKRGPKAFKTFLDALRYKDAYSWLADKLEKKDLIQREMQSTDEKDSTNDWNGILVRGGVPHSLMHHVERTNLLKKVREQLKFLSTKRGWLVLHGMTGCGKSVLAAESVRSRDLLSQCFPSGVFWVQVGNVEEGTLLIKMQVLCERLDKDYRNSAATCIEQASHRLRDLFAKEKFSRALLVLDDVWCQTAIKAFDVGISVLVTTRDRTVEDAILNYHEHIGVDTRLSVDESKTLLSKHVRMDVTDLPETAERVISKLKGFPMAIAMVGARIAAHSQDKTQWERVLNELCRRRRSSAEKNTERHSLDMNQAIRSNVECLDYQYRQYFEGFAIFLDDVHIPTQVLCTLWDCHKFEVDDIMLIFVDKSLATRVWDDKNATYIYGIHDLVMGYLQDEKADTLQNLHKILIEKYREKCDDNWELLPNDGYIHWYLGYHIWHADMHDLLSKIYLDLKYVMVKLNVTGPGDLLHDYRRYGKFIAEEDKDVKNDFEHFVRVNAYRFGDKQLDILQLAVVQPQASAVYKQAKKLVLSSDPSKIYFEWLTRDDVKSACIGSVKLHTEPVLSALFTPSGNHIISCGEDSVIRIYNYMLGKERLQFRGHSGAIHCCSLSENGERLATCSLDGTIKVWLLKGVENGIDSAELSPTSPSSIFSCEPFQSLERNSRQKPEAVLITTFTMKEKVQCCAISPDGNEVLSGGEEGAAKVWAVPDPDDHDVFVSSDKSKLGEEKCSLKGHEQKVTACRYATDGSIFATAAEDGQILIWNRKTKKLRKTLAGEVNSICSCCFFPDASKLAIASDHSVAIWDVSSGSMVRRFDDPYHACVRSVSVSRDGRLLAAGTTVPLVIVWNLEANSIIASHKGHKEWIHCVSFSRDGQRLLSTSEDKTVMMWDTKAASDQQNYRLAFSAHISDDIVTVAAPDLNNKIQILRGDNDPVIIEPNSSLCNVCTTLSQQTDKLALGMSDGVVQVYCISDEKPHLVCSLSEHTMRVSCCTFAGDSNVLVTGSEDTSVRIWSLGDGIYSSVECLGHTDFITDVKLYDNDTKVLSSSRDGTLIVWDEKTGSKLFSCVGHQESILACDISPNEEFLLSASADNSAMLWHAKDGSLVKTVQHEACVRSCRFFQDGSHFLTGDDKGTVKKWSTDLACKTHLLLLEAHDCWVEDLVLSQSSEYLMTVSNTLKFWNLKTKQCCQTFQLQGGTAKRVCASNDFKTFVTVDDAGVLYILKIMERSKIT